MKVFLQYSWDSEAHKEWVLELANRLTSDGVDLCFDRYDLKVGSNNLHFMEQIESAEKVILIMSSGYKTKADNRFGGIGYEYQILSSEIALELASNQKFIPVLRDGSPEISIPKILRPFLFLDMRDDKLFEQRYLELLHLVYDEPMIIKPKLGKRPPLGNMLKSSPKADLESQIATSKKVHYVVANELYQLMSDIEGEVEVDREKVLNSIENIYEKYRDISYDKSDFIEPEFHEIVSKLLLSFSNNDTRVFLTGNSEAIWENINKDTQYELKTIMQEIMINMKKHSNGSLVRWRFTRVFNDIQIIYSDNGIGFKTDLKLKNGLNNVKRRVDFIGGEITFSNNTDDGLKIRVSFPSTLDADFSDPNKYTDFDILIISLLSQGMTQRDIPQVLISKNIRPSGLSSIEKRLNLIKSNLNLTSNEQLIIHSKKIGIIH